MKQKQTRREFVRILFMAGQAAVASQFLPASLFAEMFPPHPLRIFRRTR